MNVIRFDVTVRKQKHAIAEQRAVAEAAIEHAKMEWRKLVAMEHGIDDHSLDYDHRPF